jgi:hypothetical protein
MIPVFQGRPDRSTCASSRWLRHALSVAGLCAVSGLAWSAPSGTVLFAAGDVHVLSATGERRELKTNGAVESGETVQTGKGRVQLRMIDGAMISLGERTVLRLDDYHLAGPAGNDERGFMSLLSGALRTISGSIGHPRVDHYKLDTPSGTIGIRGTEYTAEVGNGLRVGVIGGRVAVCNDGGCVDVPKGASAYSPSRAVKPTLGAQRLVYLTPANATDAGPAVTRPAPPPTTLAGADSALPISGDLTSQFLVAALKPPSTTPPSTGDSGGDALPTLPGSTVVNTPTGSATSGTAAPITLTPAPVPAPIPSPPPSPEPAPSPSPTPGAPPSPTPAPAPGPSPAPSPTPTPLVSGKAILGLTWSTTKGAVASGLTQGAATFDGHGALVELDNATTGSTILEKGVATDVGNNGVIAWGRWTGGQSKLKDSSGSDSGNSGNGKGNGDNSDNGNSNGKLATLHYFAVESVPSGAVTGIFTSFASTAPTVQSGGSLVATGTVNSATGSFSASLHVQTGGTASYSLTVPVSGQTFSLVGVASQTSASGFSGISLISSTGSGCAGGCTGSLGNNVSVIGQIAGTQATQAGIVYGFDSRIGNVSGVIVFKH